MHVGIGASCSNFRNSFIVLIFAFVNTIIAKLKFSK